MSELNGLIAGTTASVGDITDYLADPMPTLSTQMITSDYAIVNENRIVLDTAMVDVGTFNLCGRETLEFQLALSDVPGLDMSMMDVSTGNRVTSVSLLAGTEVAASALIDTTVRDSQHRLFYKFDNDSDMAITYTI